MSALELALKKQRLQIESAALRDQIAADAQVLTPLFSGADRLRDGVRWLRRNPDAVVVAGVALAIVRPRVLIRWARRGYVAWQGVRRLQAWTSARP